MEKIDVKRLLSGMSTASKKEFMNSLIVSILSDLNESEKKELLRTAVTGQTENRHLSAMVEY